MDTVVKFDPEKISDHLSEIQSLIAKEQHHLADGGWGMGPAYYQACENVGREHFFPFIGGPKLASEIGKLQARRARDGKAKIAKDVPPLFRLPDNNNRQSGQISIVMGEVEDIPQTAGRASFSSDPNIEKLKASILAMSIGRQLPVMFDSKELGRKTANRMYAWANKIHCKDNGWVLRAPTVDDAGTIMFQKVPYHNSKR